MQVPCPLITFRSNKTETTISKICFYIITNPVFNTEHTISNVLCVASKVWDVKHVNSLFSRVPSDIMNNKVFYQHPNLMRVLGMHETVMEVMVNVLGSDKSQVRRCGHTGRLDRFSLSVLAGVDPVQPSAVKWLLPSEELTNHLNLRSDYTVVPELLTSADWLFSVAKEQLIFQLFMILSTSATMLTSTK